MKQLSNELKLRLQLSLSWDAAELEDEIREKKKELLVDPGIIEAKEQHLELIEELLTLFQSAKKVYLD